MKTIVSESTNAGSRGQLTAMLARKISKDWYEYGYDVLYDLDPSNKNVGKIVSWFGDLTEKDHQKETRLSHDLALVKKNSNEVICLIEIDETNATQKTLLRDAFGELFGKQVHLQEECELSVNEKTTLIVLGKSKDLLEKSNRPLSEKMTNVNSSLSTTKSAIGRVFIETFSDEEKFASVLERAFKGEL